jgi:hypothetical protein
MCKKFLVFALMLGLVPASYGVVIGDWENSMDGWVVEWGETTSYDTIGHTLNDHSLKVMPSWTEWYVGAMDGAGGLRRAGYFSLSVWASKMMLKSGTTGEPDRKC